MDANFTNLFIALRGKILEKTQIIHICLFVEMSPVEPEFPEFGSSLPAFGGYSETEPWLLSVKNKSCPFISLLKSFCFI